LSTVSVASLIQPSVATNRIFASPTAATACRVSLM
jgi:hypothetical protein